MWGANAWATVPWAVASATTAPTRGLLTLTSVGQNALTVSDARRYTTTLFDIKIGTVEITGEQWMATGLRHWRPGAALRNIYQHGGSGDGSNRNHLFDQGSIRHGHNGTPTGVRRRPSAGFNRAIPPRLFARCRGHPQLPFRWNRCLPNSRRKTVLYPTITHSLRSLIYGLDWSG